MAHPRASTFKSQAAREAFIKAINDPVFKTASLYSIPTFKGPGSQIQASGTDFFKMLPNNVNKTSLHPTGVTPHQEHTELEQELHDKAHIDYDRVAIIPNPSVAALYEDALVYETGTAITSSGALTAYSGAKTGRSPLDKRIVEEPSSKDNIWYVQTQTADNRVLSSCA
jgi:phosphoenolpyruvate carboxykinase (ATP)